MTTTFGITLLIALVAYLGAPYVIGKIRHRRNLKKLHEAANNTALLGVVYPVETTSKTKGKTSK
jgi:hypothetical protein